MKREKLAELDILRVLGTMIIVFHHLPDYTGNFYNLNYFGLPINLSYLNVLNTYFGLGLFVFISGFALYYAHPQISPEQGVFSFLKKRFVRVFPLYLVALGLFVLTFRGLNLFETVVHVMGLHLLMAPRFIVPMPTLWFVGLIVMLYPFYALLVKYTRSYRGMILFSLSAFAVFWLLRYFFDIVEYRFFLYFFIFFAGVICCRVELFSAYHLSLRHLAVTALILLASILVVRSFHRGSIYEYGEVTEVFMAQVPITDIITVFVALNVMMLAFIFIAFVLARKIKGYLNKITLQILSLISFSSYGIYLFHRPLLGLMTNGLGSPLAYAGSWKLVFLVMLGLPLVLFISYLMQASNDKIMKRFSFGRAGGPGHRA